MSFNVIGSDYKAYFNSGPVSQWEKGGFGQVNFAQKFTEYFPYFPFCEMGFDFTFKSTGASHMVYSDFRELLDMWERYGNTKIVPAYYGQWSTQQAIIGKQSFYDDWVNFITEFKDDRRIVAIQPFGEPNRAYIPSDMSYKDAMIWMKGLIGHLHGIKPEIKIIFPWFNLVYKNTPQLIADMKSVGIPSYCIIDCMHPYLDPKWTPNVTNKAGVDQKINKFYQEELLPFINAFDLERLWSGETFWWPTDSRKDTNGVFLQDYWIKGIAELFTSNGVSFHLWSMTNWYAFHETKRVLQIGSAPPPPDQTYEIFSGVHVAGSGTVQPEGIQTVKLGESIRFTAYPNTDEGYFLDHWAIDGRKIAGNPIDITRTVSKRYFLEAIMGNTTEPPTPPEAICTIKEATQGTVLAGVMPPIRVFRDRCLPQRIKHDYYWISKYLAPKIRVVRNKLKI